MEKQVTRREFSAQAVRTLIAVSLLDILYRKDALGADVEPTLVRWVRDLNDLARDVQIGDLKQTLWQEKTEEVLAKVDLGELLKRLDFDTLIQKMRYVDSGAGHNRFDFPEIAGIPTRLVFGKQIFSLKRGCSVVPHGHNNMATAFLILRGELHGRHYDRKRDEAEHIIIEPTIDRQFGAGEYSTISDYKDNVHWFKARSERAFIFNFHIFCVNDENKKKTGRVYVDPNGERTEGGLIRAPRISSKEAERRYGRERREV